MKTDNVLFKKPFKERYFNSRTRRWNTRWIHILTNSETELTALSRTKNVSTKPKSMDMGSLCQRDANQCPYEVVQVREETITTDPVTQESKSHVGYCSVKVFKPTTDSTHAACPTSESEIPEQEHSSTHPIPQKSTESCGPRPQSKKSEFMPFIFFLAVRIYYWDASVIPPLFSIPWCIIPIRANVIVKFYYLESEINGAPCAWCDISEKGCTIFEGVHASYARF